MSIGFSRRTMKWDWAEMFILFSIYSVCFQGKHLVAPTFFIKSPNILLVIVLRAGSANSYVGKKIPRLRTELCGRICQWSGGSSVFLSLNEMPFMNKKAMQFITIATDLLTLFTFQQSKFRLVYLDQFILGIRKQNNLFLRENPSISCFVK